MISVKVYCAAALLLLLFGCNGLELQSHWTSQPLPINGERSAAWDSVMIRIEGKPFMTGILNDGAYLYLTLVTNDRSLQRQIMFRGLTAWFDYKGGDDKRFGIHFPRPPQMGFLSGRPPEENARGPEGDSGWMQRMPPVDTTEAEIIGPGEGEHHRENLTHLTQVQVKVTVSTEGLTYQLRVPLLDNGREPYAIGARPGTVIGIGLSAGARESQRAERSGGGDEERGGGMGGGRRGGRGGGQRSAGSQAAEPLNVWAKLHLAESH
jgi:hypothetical protein